MKRLILMLMSTLAARRRRAGGGAGQVSVEAGEDRRAVCAGRRHRHHRAPVRRQLKNILGQQFVVENKPGAFGILAIEEMARSKPDGYTLMVGNVSTNAITPVLFKKKFNIDFEKDVVSVSRLDIYPSFLIVDHHELRRQECQRTWSPGQEKSRQGALHQRRRRQLPAFRHGDLRAARRRRHDPHPEQDRRRRHDQRSRGRRRAGRVPQRGELGGDDQGRQAAAARGASPSSGCQDYPDVPTLAEAGFPGVGTLHWQSMLAPAATPKPVLDTLFKAIVEAAKQPGAAGGVRQAARQHQAQRVARTRRRPGSRASSTPGARSRPK